MTPQIPGYLLSSESIVRPVVTIIALGLIWLGAARMPASAKSRYTTAGVLSAVLIGWTAVAQYLGAANTYFATTERAVPTVLFGLLIPPLLPGSRRGVPAGTMAVVRSPDFLRALNQRDCACNTDPPASSSAIMRRADPYRGETSVRNDGFGPLAVTVLPIPLASKPPQTMGRLNEAVQALKGTLVQWPLLTIRQQCRAHISVATANTGAAQPTN